MPRFKPKGSRDMVTCFTVAESSLGFSSKTYHKAFINVLMSQSTIGTVLKCIALQQARGYLLKQRYNTMYFICLSVQYSEDYKQDILQTTLSQNVSPNK
ncbi:hypothetical protein XENTR_v10007947 [Xenopus tropicalis]|nr:hypothetical protein XENTR_v10007947 [Xenopus tropicalis]